ncbi:hypothetical protein K440DRAFT_643369 [Wilcoxina mikolae CBS 423.85]|nr:hypothetical protein K440DRAFT_643369 [Wilcoxina mikolae CBS 423.85]
MGSDDESSSDESSSSSSASPEPLQTISNRSLPPPPPTKRGRKADNCPPVPRKRPALLSQSQPQADPIQDDVPKVFWEHPGYYPYTKEQVNESADSDWSDGEPRLLRPDETVQVVKRLQKQAIMLQKQITKVSEERKKREKSRQRRKWYLNKKRRDAEKKEMEAKAKEMEAKAKESVDHFVMNFSPIPDVLFLSRRTWAPSDGGFQPWKDDTGAISVHIAPWSKSWGILKPPHNLPKL